ncbi:hypothetical protein FTO74_12580 [Granulicella sp. WH15]|uniref:DUF6734 family protein n=1 Tax=Granulicella sp. WH15 TaxID=2602070 RepID=UPI0013668C1D|nr:DUF6734 family protein [Granulicella sp. WH15]QHN04112.1 hypothetical protein FTO74_12580 [Granulicella sp. WH15]
MRAVWSFWSRPHLSGRNFTWKTELHHRLSWILSVESARPHFSSLALWTDDAGAEMLIGQLGLRFDEVSTSLNVLAEDDTDWWMMGKLQCYAEQYQPYVHIDSDVYLFQPLPEWARTAAVVAQNPEDTVAALPWYDADRAALMIRVHGNRRIPEEWTWYRTFSPVQTAACCGIVGGNRTDLLRRYADTVLSVLRAPENRRAFDDWDDKRVLNPLFEQYLLAACAAYEGVPITYLFESYGQAVNGGAARLGFTHLMAGSKVDPDLMERLERRVARCYPELYERAVSSMEVLEESAAKDSAPVEDEERVGV